MRELIILLAALTLSSLAHAGFPPRTICSSLGGYIQIANYKVTIQTYKHPNLVTETFDESDLDIKMEVIQEMPKQTLGCSSRVVVFKNVTISKKDGSALPSAYNRNAVDGVLNDYMICSTSYSWMPAQGESCFKKN